jgi:hypothetical protein
MILLENITWLITCNNSKLQESIQKLLRLHILEQEPIDETNGRRVDGGRLRINPTFGEHMLHALTGG